MLSIPSNCNWNLNKKFYKVSEKTAREFRLHEFYYFAISRRTKGKIIQSRILKVASMRTTCLKITLIKALECGSRKGMFKAYASKMKAQLKLIFYLH